MNYLDFKEFTYNQHDVVCNQKYGKIHPYSFHLECVYNQAGLWKNKYIPMDQEIYNAVMCGLWGHDLIEDARITFNDIKELTDELTAQIIFGCTESTGRNRAERHDDAFFARLISNKYSVFVKLCDIMANVKYSMLTNSSMYSKYKKEWSHFKQKTNDFICIYPEMYDHLDKLFEL